MKTKKVYVFFTKGDGLISKMICKITNAEWSHCGVGFMLKDGSKVYYEALAGKGFQGDKPMDSLIKWQTEKPTQRRLAIIELPALASAGDLMLGACKAYSEVVTYSEMQLVAHYLMARFNKKVRTTLRRVICSEMVSRVLFLGGVDLRTEKYTNHDSQTPQSVYDAIGRELDCGFDYLAL